MRNRNRFLLTAGTLLAGIGFVTSCSVTDLQPATTISKSSFYQTGDDAAASVIAVYNGLQDFNTTYRLYHWGEARADQSSLAVWWGQSGDIVLAKKQLLNQNNELTDWSSMYTLIQRANEAITNVPTVPTSLDFNQQARNNLLGEAYALRAYCYFTLARTFGSVPLVTTPSDNANKDYLVKQASEKEVLDQIESDLTTAGKLFASKYVAPSTPRNRMSAGAAAALMTHVKLWRNDYKAAEDSATSVITNYGYSLMAPDNYSDQFLTSGGTSEIIFSIGFDINRRNPIINKESWSGGGYGIVPAVAWTKKQDARGETIRGSQYQYASPGDDGYGLVLKFQRATTAPSWNIIDFNGTVMRDYPLLRLADLYLLRAEARNRQGKTADALADLNVIRKRARVPEYGAADLTSADAVEDAVLAERDIELCFEGQRWFDLVRVARHGRPDVLYNQATNLLSGDLKAQAVDFLKSKSNGGQWGSWHMPVNRAELANNKNLQQNPAYK